MNLPVQFANNSVSPLGGVRSPADVRGDQGAQGEEFNPWLTMDLKDVETKMVKFKERLPDGTEVECEKEMVVCPECGSVSCACLAQVTLQKRLDEENAQGVRGAEKPDPMAMLSQGFNQMSHNLGHNGSSLFS